MARELPPEIQLAIWRDRSCTGKLRFDTEAEAARMMRRCRRQRGRKKVGILNTYSCHFCGGYHFGHRRFKKAEAGEKVQGKV